jgi:hypothetical protein
MSITPWSLLEQLGVWNLLPSRKLRPQFIRGCDNPGNRIPGLAALRPLPSVLKAITGRVLFPIPRSLILRLSPATPSRIYPFTVIDRCTSDHTFYENLGCYDLHDSEKMTLTGTEVAEHNSKESCWVIVHVGCLELAQ